MAITTYNITDTTTTHLETLKGILETVATDYFTSFVLSEDKLTLQCMDGSNPIITFVANSTSGRLVSATLSGDNTTKLFNTATNLSHYFCKIAKTTKGIALKLKQVNSVKPYAIFITKSNKGKTAVYIDTDSFGVTATDVYHSGWCVTSESASISKVTSYTGSTTKPLEHPLITLSYVPCAGIEDYCPDLFITPTSPYSGVEAQLVYNGETYLYNGAVALRDE